MLCADRPHHSPQKEKKGKKKKKLPLTHTLTVESLDPVASRRHPPPPFTACKGSHARQVTHLVWPLQAPRGAGRAVPPPPAFVPAPSQIRTPASMPPDARNAPSGDQARASTQPPWPPRTASGPAVVRSHSRTVVSPLPDARRVPSGEKTAASTASVWPGRDAAHRVTGRTRKGACGRQVTSVAPSREAAVAARCGPSAAAGPARGVPATENAYGRVGLSSLSRDAPFTELTRASSWGGVTVEGTSRVGPGGKAQGEGRRGRTQEGVEREGEKKKKFPSCLSTRI